MWVHAEIAGGIRHKLPKAYGTDRATCSGIVRALNLDVGSVKERPISDGKPCATQRTMPGIAQSRGLDRIQDFWGGAGGRWGRDRCLDSGVGNAGFCEEKKAPVCLLRRGNQLAVGADLEDETVGQGRGRGTNACTQSNDERSRAIRCP